MSDHKTRSEEILEASRDWSDTRNQPHAAGQDALVHAVLALAEQQRIGNLIAMADHAVARFGFSAGAAGGMGTLFSYPETEEGNIQVRDDVRAVLGI